MAIISEKIVHPSPFHVCLYKEGFFWVAYEQSAYYVAQFKGYKPNKKYIKMVGDSVVSVGFPHVDALINELDSLKLIQACNKELYFVEIIMYQAIDISLFESWKIMVENTSQKKEPKAVVDVKAQIKAFPLAYKTPMEAFIFLKELQDIVLKSDV